MPAYARPAFARPAIAVVLALAAAPAWAGDPPAAGSKTEDPVPALVARLATSQPADVRLAAAKEAATVQDARVVTPLGRLLRDEVADVRLAAVAALGARTDTADKKHAATVLAERLDPLDKSLLAKPEAKPELLAAIASLKTLAQPTSIDALLKGIDEDEDADLVEARAMAVANVPAAAAIEGLIDRMSRGRRDGSGIRARISRALAWATGEQPANDPDHWRAWWKDHKATFDFAAAAERRAEGGEPGARKGKKPQPPK
jgi:hypothetical protein